MRDRLPSLLRFFGSLIIVLSFVLGCILLVAEHYFGTENPYASLLVYGFTPTGIGIGVAMMVVGFIVHRRNLARARVPAPLPIIDFNSDAVRSVLFAVVVGGAVFSAVSAVATYNAYHWAESDEFCGTVCHKVMRPEFEAHGTSPHARVACVDCHIGPGAESFAKAKLNGLNQLFGVLTSSYHLPIKTPVKQLREARYICEQCHSRVRLEDSNQKQIWRFSYDRLNSPSRFDMLMKIGGVNPVNGETVGIHWHAQHSPEVWYYPRDEKRLDIPYVEVRKGNKVTVYKTDELTSPPPKEQLLRMDCLTCHNRPAHRYLAPALLVDEALAEDSLDRKIPYMKRNAVEILSLDFSTTQEAEIKIRDEVVRRFPTSAGVSSDQQKQIAEILVRLFKQNNFPEQRVNWRGYPMHIGHRSSPGCDRCHDGRHENEEGKVVTRDCQTCHEFLRQSHGSDAYADVPYVSRPFEHPAGSAAKFDPEKICSDCHAPDAELSPANSARRGPGGALPPIATSTAAE
ncbi:MAG: NapC/NirT family cytochrome c [Deltaproteobacteria bacterium]|nr:NapC/NirT family cytochrome c [Deltaproteobacteria bacterium]